jgi:tRNA(Ile)-lysidine synthase
LVDYSLLVSNVGCAAVVNWIQTKTKLLRRFSPGMRYLVGVSAGRDSAALLHWLVSLGYNELIVCHLNHQLRGRSSDADARFVEKLAKKYEVDFELGAANVRVLAKKKRMSIETAAREARYSFFAKAAKGHGCRTIFLAHHADDLVETLLINLFRGAGSAGLVAIRESSTRQIDDVELTIVRPFLPVWRKEIDSYVKKYHLRFREDASNKNLDPLRNRLRRRVIPFLEKVLGRNIRPTIWRAAAIAVEEENWINGQLPDSSGAELSVPQLRALPVALQRRAILKWLRSKDISEVGFDVIERVRSLADPDAAVAKVNLPRNRHARRRAKTIFIE